MASAVRKGGRTGGAAGIRRKTHGGDGRIRPWDAPSRQGNAAGPAAGRRLDTPDSATSGAEAGEATHWGPGENAGGRISQSAGEQREAPSELHRHPPDGGAVPAPLRTVPAVASRSQRSPVTGPGASVGAGETGSVRRPPLRLPSGRSCPRGPSREHWITKVFRPDSECCPPGTRATSSMARFCSGAGSVSRTGSGPLGSLRIRHWRRLRVASSCSRPEKLCNGRPCSLVRRSEVPAFSRSL